MALAPDKLREYLPVQYVTPRSGEVAPATPVYIGPKITETPPAPLAPKRVSIIESRQPPATANTSILYHWYERHMTPKAEIKKLARWRTDLKLGEGLPVDHLAEWLSAETRIREQHQPQMFRGFLRFIADRIDHLEPTKLVRWKTTDPEIAAANFTEWLSAETRIREQHQPLQRAA